MIGRLRLRLECADPRDCMKIVTAIETHAGAPEIAERLAKQVLAELDGPPDAMLIFASAHLCEELELIAPRLQELTGARAFAGVTGETTICGDVEYEGAPALAVWAARMPNTRISAFHLSRADLGRFERVEELNDFLGVPADDAPYFVLFADPFSTQPGELLDWLGQAYPERPVIGGVASAGAQPRENRFVFGGQVLHEGACGLVFSGDVRMRTIVSQGCRPIGESLVVTKADGNLIQQLAGKPAKDVAFDMLRRADASDQEAVRRGLFVGRVIDEHQRVFNRGDFLIRNAIGFDQDSGAMAVDDMFRPGQTIQFHVRDAATAGRDLEDMLLASDTSAARGALLFTCNGRGTRLFNSRSHDARAVADRCGGLPTAGFCCAGEFGPVGTRNYIHGYTASIGFFEPESS